MRRARARIRRVTFKDTGFVLHLPRFHRDVLGRVRGCVNTAPSGLQGREITGFALVLWTRDGSYVTEVDSTSESLATARDFACSRIRRFPG